MRPTGRLFNDSRMIGQRIVRADLRREDGGHNKEEQHDAEPPASVSAKLSQQAHEARVSGLICLGCYDLRFVTNLNWPCHKHSCKLWSTVYDLTRRGVTPYGKKTNRYDLPRRIRGSKKA